MTRDWQKDMKLCEDFQRGSGWAARDLIAEQPQMTIHWLQQYAAEKERADQAELLIDNLGGGDRYKYIRHVRKELNDEITLLVEHIIEVEAREKKLRDEIDGTIPLLEAAGLLVRASRLKEFLSSLYPLDKEEEA